MHRERSIVLALDIGEWAIKAGLAGENKPRIIIPNVLSYNRYYVEEIDANSSFEKPYFIGNEAIQAKLTGEYIFPIENGKITNRDALEKILHHLFFERLKINPIDHPLAVVIKHTTTRRVLEDYLEIFFDIFNVPKMYFLTSSEMSLLLSLSDSGIVIDVGQSMTSIVPFYQKHVITSDIHIVPLGGRDITEHLRTLLHQRGIRYKSKKEYFIINDIKENYCYVALDPEKEKKVYRYNPNLKREYVFPDGTTFTLEEERFLAPELLFDPLIAHSGHDSIIKKLQKVFEQADITIRRELIENIIITGGTTILAGFAERMQKEISEELQRETFVFAHPSRRIGAWLGASIFINEVRKTNSITKKEYNEYGTEVLQRIFY